MVKPDLGLMTRRFKDLKEFSFFFFLSGERNGFVSDRGARVGGPGPRGPSQSLGRGPGAPGRRRPFTDWGKGVTPGEPKGNGRGSAGSPAYASGRRPPRVNRKGK